MPSPEAASFHAAATRRPPPGVGDAPGPARRQAAGEQDKPTLVFFYSATSGGSRRAEGFLAQILQRRRNRPTFMLRRVGYEAHADLAARLGVEQSPAIVVVEATRVRAKLERPRGCIDIKATLAPRLKWARACTPETASA